MKRYLLLLFAPCVWAQDVLDRQLPMANNEANTLFEARQFDQAIEAYESLLENDPSNGAITYNLANAYASKGNLEKAQELYEQAARSDNPQARNRSRYNLGTVQMAGQNAGEAVKQFVDYLRENPNDLDAKRNLELALRMLEQQPPQQQQQDQNQEQQEDQENQENQQQQQSNSQQSHGEDEQQQDQQQSQQQSEDSEQQQENEQNQQQNQQEQDQQQQSSQGQKQDSTEQEQSQQQEQEPREQEELTDQVKQQILEALNEQEQQQQKEFQKRKIGKVKRRAKDW